MSTNRSRQASRASWSPLVWAAACLVLLACAAPARPTTPPADANTDVTFVIPSGTEAALEQSAPSAFRWPDEIQLQSGQSVVVTNNDYAMHYFFDIPIAPGQTIRKPFLRAGEFVYQGGMSCSISRTSTIKVHVS